MRYIRLENGEWVTSAIAVGVGIQKPQCPDNTCIWEDFGPPTPEGLLPLVMQLQRCVRCQWTRGRYLTKFIPKKEPLRLDGRKIQERDICIVGISANKVDLTKYKQINLGSCDHCYCAVVIEEYSFNLLMNGADILCLDCAIKTRPNMRAGKDPDTGRPLTLKEIVQQPNSIGAYRFEDFK